MTEVVVTACTVIADSALHTDVPVRTIFAVFTALRTDVGTFRAACAAGTNHIHAKFAFLTFCTVVAIAADAIKADPAVEAKLVAGTLRAFLIAIFTAKGTFRAAVAAVTDPVSAF